MTAITCALEMALQIPSLLLSAAVVVLMVLSSPGTEGGDSESKCRGQGSPEPALWGSCSEGPWGLWDVGGGGKILILL